MNGSPASASRNIALLVFVILAWGLTWVAMKIVVRELTPLWAVALRTMIAMAVLLPALVLTRQFIVPKRSDVPVVVAISLFHMVAFAALMTAGLQYVSAGRTIVLGYTTPLWVVPAAWLLLKEPFSLRQLIGVLIGLAGLLSLFDRSALNWQDQKALLGNGLIVLAAVSWSASIVYTRAHKWTATPFQLVFWQALLAAVVLSVLAYIFEGVPTLTLSNDALWALLYNGVVGTALGYWAATVVNKNMPAISASLGLLATPVVGIGSSMLILGEPLDPRLLVAAAMILAGIAIGMRR